MPSVVVGETTELPPGTRRIVEVAGRSIGVFNVGGEYLAIRNRCPHQGGPLCEGVTVGAITSDQPGEYRYERPGEIIRCPWHAWEFDLRTGASWFDPARQRVRAYEVEVRRGGRAGRRRACRRGPGLLAGSLPGGDDPGARRRRYVVLDLD